ncbi:MAG TPA: CAP domain-containing protein [Actinomycetes bacterium]|nr:CAP domain-containing protein [Actinomycetes bacterium]
MTLLASLAAVASPAQAQAACPVSAGDQAIDAEEQQLLHLINDYRAANGRYALVLDPTVTTAAAWFSRDMATQNYFPLDHIDLNGRNIPQRLTWCGVVYNAWAENIYGGSPEAEVVFEAWRNSAIHNTNMLRPEVYLAGIGRAFNAGSALQWYWTLDLTSAQGTFATVQGSTWYSDGTRAKSGPAGTPIQAYGAGALQNVPYRLVLGTGTPDRACQAVVGAINPATLFAGPSGLLGRVNGTVPAGTGPGLYKLCFEDTSTGNLTGTGGATFRVTA